MADEVILKQQQQLRDARREAAETLAASNDRVAKVL